MASTGSGPFARVSGDAEPGHLDQGRRAVSPQGPGFLQVAQGRFETGISQAGGNGDSKRGRLYWKSPRPPRSPSLPLSAPFCPSVARILSRGHSVQGSVGNEVSAFAVSHRKANQVCREFSTREPAFDVCHKHREKVGGPSSKPWVLQQLGMPPNSPVTQSFTAQRE